MTTYGQLVDVYNDMHRWVSTIGYCSLAGNGRIIIWETMTGAPLINIPAHDTTITFVSFIKSNEEILSASEDGTLALWKVPPQVG